jgi:hypothetical protein
MLEVNTTNSATKGLVLRPITGQTADLIDVYNSAGNLQLYVNSSGALNNNTYYYGPGISNGAATAIVGTNSNGVIITGNVGIGTTSPSQLLTVGNNNQFTVTSGGAVNVPSGNLYALTITTGGIANNNNNTYANATFSNSGVQITRNVADSNSSLIVNQVNASSTGDILDLQAAGSTKVAFLQNGNVGIGRRHPMLLCTITARTLLSTLSATLLPTPSQLPRTILFTWRPQLLRAR